MKKIYLLFSVLLATLSQAQTSGITYQAVILNPLEQKIPGYNNDRKPLANKQICLDFKIVSGNTVNYEETMVTTTDEFGMVNVIIGTGIRVGGLANSLATINWDGNPKNLVVSVDTAASCSNYKEISNQPFTAVPFAMYAANSGSGGIKGPQGPEGVKGLQGLQGPQGFQGIPGPLGLKGEVGLQGNQGINGKVGLNSLLKVSPVDPDENCASGGLKIEGGTDINNDLVLQNEEINTDLTYFICNGIDSNFTNASNNGDMLYWNNGSWISLQLGNQGDVLSVINGRPSWINAN